MVRVQVPRVHSRKINPGACKGRLNNCLIFPIRSIPAIISVLAGIWSNFSIRFIRFAFSFKYLESRMMFPQMLRLQSKRINRNFAIVLVNLVRGVLKQKNIGRLMFQTEESYRAFRCLSYGRITFVSGHLLLSAFP